MYVHLFSNLISYSILNMPQRKGQKRIAHSEHHEYHENHSHPQIVFHDLPRRSRLLHGHIQSGNGWGSLLSGVGNFLMNNGKHLATAAGVAGGIAGLGAGISTMVKNQHEVNAINELRC